MNPPVLEATIRSVVLAKFQATTRCLGRGLPRDRGLLLRQLVASCGHCCVYICSSFCHFSSVRVATRDSLAGGDGSRPLFLSVPACVVWSVDDCPGSV